jgi:hypothetical protein
MLWTLRVRPSGGMLGTLPEDDQCYRGHSPCESTNSRVKDAGNSRLVNAEILAYETKQIVGHSSEDIHGRYVYLETAVQAKAIVSLKSTL